MSHSRRPYSRGRDGFTLIELMVAMAFVALLASGIVLSITTALHIWRKTQETNGLHQEARAVLGVITRDVRGAYLGLGRSSGFFYGTPADTSMAGTTAPPVDALYFTTESSAWANVGLLPEETRQDWDQTRQAPVCDVVAVRWEWKEPDQVSGVDRPGLYRVSSVATNAEPQEEGADTDPISSTELISSDIERLQFRYYDGTEWADVWDSAAQASRAPQAVSIEFVLRDPHTVEAERQGWVSNAAPEPEDLRTFRTVVQLATP